MPNHSLSPSVHEPVRIIPDRDQIQLALAIANAVALKSLLTNCVPAIFQAHLIGNISAEIAIPTPDHQVVDGMLHFEAIQCVLADTHQEVGYSSHPEGRLDRKESARLTQCESETYTLGQNLTLAAAVSLLASAGWCPQQVEAILSLSADARHKSWWYTLDANAQFTVPFLRLTRTLRYPDGTFTLQYKDYFEQDKPICFRSIPQKVAVKAKPDDQPFGEVLRQVNAIREAFKIHQVILICNTLSDLESQAFINQGISIYATEALALPRQSDCGSCVRRACPMNAQEDSPVAMCYGFLAS
jgi:bacterioferritin-associated ferredoxin